MKRLIPLLTTLLTLSMPPHSSSASELWIVFTGISALKAVDGGDLTVFLPLSDYPISINGLNVPAHFAYVRFLTETFGPNSTRPGCQKEDDPIETFCQIAREEIKLSGPFEAQPLHVDPSFETYVVSMREIASSAKLASKFQTPAFPPGLAARLKIGVGTLLVNTQDVPVDTWSFGNNPPRTVAHAAVLKINLKNTSTPVTLQFPHDKIVFKYPTTSPLTIEIGQTPLPELPDPANGMQTAVGNPDEHFLLHYQLLGSRKCNNPPHCDDVTEMCPGSGGPDFKCPPPVHRTGPAPLAAPAAPAAPTATSAPGKKHIGLESKVPNEHVTPGIPVKKHHVVQPPSAAVRAGSLLHSPLIHPVGTMPCVTCSVHVGGSNCPPIRF